MNMSLLALGFVFVCSSVHAFDYEVLFEDRDWRVDINIYDEVLECEALTSSGSVTLSLFLSQSDLFTMSFYNEAWRFPEADTATAFVVAIDGVRRWEMSGVRSGNQISITPDPGGDELRRFLREIRNGRRIALANDAGSEIASFSLSGSAASLVALGECGTAIRAPSPSDPFATEASAMADPFR